MAKTYRKVAEFKTVEDFSAYLKSENINIGLVPEVPADGSAALARKAVCKGRTIGNRWAILPMEGWDCMADGTPSEFTRRRWLNFAASGAKLLYGTEAAAVMHSGRSNPRQLLVADHTADALASICAEMRQAHKDRFGRNDDLVIGLQLTHSGRYSHPNKPDVLESKTAYSHPLLDKKFGNDASNVVTDEEVGEIVRHFIKAAVIAQKAGFDFVDIKHAHGYLGHEFLTAYDRPGPYGGSFENRTRFFREIAGGIRKAAPGLELSARISIFDILPFVKGEDGVGKPMEWSGGRYPYAFGGDGSGMRMDPELTETVQFVKLMEEYGVGLICATIGSPYYNVHMQRPAYYPVSDGYLMPEHPLYNVFAPSGGGTRTQETVPGNADRRFRLHLSSGVSPECRRVCRGARRGGFRRHRAHGALLSGDVRGFAGREDFEPLQNLPDFRGLHECAQKRDDLRLLSARQFLQTASRGGASP